MEKLVSMSLTYQIIGCSKISTSLIKSIPRMALPSPPNNVGMKKCFQDRVKCTGPHKLQAHHVNCLNTFVLHFSNNLTKDAVDSI